MCGPRGPLLPANIASQLPQLFFPDPPPLDDLRVVGVRIDPCFGAAPGAALTSPDCRRQVRLVAQPLVEAANMTNGTATTLDATVHLFYDLAPAEFDQLVARLRGLKAIAQSATSCKPIQVHPVMVQQGLDGAYATELRALVLDFAGMNVLTQVAVMTRGLQWDFQMFRVNGGLLVADPIPRLGTATRQTFIVPDVPTNSPSADPAPADSPMSLLFDRDRVADAPIDSLETAIDESFRIENPKLETPKTIDCASCHVAGRLRRMALDRRNLTYDSAQEYRNATFDLSFISDDRAIGSQRIFGYFNRTPSLSARVTHESAEVAAALRAP